VTQRRPAGFLAIPALFAPVAVCGIPGHTSSGSQLSAEVAVLALVVGVVGFESTVSLGLIGAALVLACAARRGVDRAHPGPAAESPVAAESEASAESHVAAESPVPAT